MPVLSPQSCAHCAGQFTPQQRRSARYCAPACQLEARRLRRAVQRQQVRRAYERRLNRRFRCLICGDCAAAQRTSRRFCSGRCRMVAFRQRRSGLVRHRRIVPAMAAQYVARQQLAAQQDSLELSSKPAAVSLAAAEVRPIPLIQARRFVAQFESAAVPAQLAYGLFVGAGLASVVICGGDYTSNLAPWRRYGFVGKIIALLRGATAAWAPRNAASKLIRGAMRLLPKEYTVVTALTDATVGERGAIYRAAGFVPSASAKGGRRVLVRFRGV
jgi:hypothetical protein